MGWDLLDERTHDSFFFLDCPGFLRDPGSVQGRQLFVGSGGGAHAFVIGRVRPKRLGHAYSRQNGWNGCRTRCAVIGA